MKLINKQELIFATNQLNKERVEDKQPKRFTFTSTNKLHIEFNFLINQIQLQFPDFTRNAIITTLITKVIKKSTYANKR